MQNRIQELLEEALRALHERGVLPPDTEVAVQIERPREEGRGDFATNLAMRLAKSAGKPPREVAQDLVEALPQAPEIAEVEIAGPGFINFRLVESVFQAIVTDILTAGSTFGESQMGWGKRVQIEFISANPTGPLHVGHGRGAAYGDALARILTAAGFKVEREYYINDAGRQMDILAISVLARYRELVQSEDTELPEKAYRGSYIRDIAQEVRDRLGDKLPLSAWPPPIREADPEQTIDHYIQIIKEQINEDRFQSVRQIALDHILAEIRADLNAFGVTFDCWTHEQTLVAEGTVDRALERLEEGLFLYEAEGASWFRSSQFGDEKDRVVVRSDGAVTYFANDIAYHWTKYKRGFDHLLDIWGADHHGYVARLKGAMEALGLDSKRLEIQLVQFASLYRGAEKIPMSTRAGQYVTLRELVAEVGRDAARFFYVLRRSDQHMDFDLELAKQDTEDNPVYYIHYAHVRIRSIHAKQKKSEGPVPSGEELAHADTNLLIEDKEGRLLRMLQRYPETVEGAALNREPHRVARYLQDLAAEFHGFYNAYRVLVEEPDLRLARLALVEAVRQVLANGLALLGVAVPERM